MTEPMAEHVTEHMTERMPEHVIKREKKNDLAGKRFGHLTAIEPTGERKNGYILWRCRCDCGNETLASSRHLKNGWATDCGCQPVKRRREDLTGRRFGKLVVIEDTGRLDKYGKCIWRCRCDCGNETETTAGQLNAGYVKSCGCLSRPPLKDWIGKHFGNLEVISYSGKRKGCHYWNCRCSCGNETEVSQSNLLSGHTKSCGCLSDPLKAKHFVEGTCLESLRPGKLLKNNTSGIRGVYKNHKNGKWAAQITFQGRTRYLGSFDKKEEAAEARTAGESIFEEILERYGMEYEKRGK